jgi:hypothetical protein
MATSRPFGLLPTRIARKFAADFDTYQRMAQNFFAERYDHCLMFWVPWCKFTARARHPDAPS